MSGGLRDRDKSLEGLVRLVHADPHLRGVGQAAQAPQRHVGLVQYLGEQREVPVGVEVVLELVLDHDVRARAGQVLVAAEGELEAVLGGVVADAHGLLPAGPVLQRDLLEGVRLDADDAGQGQLGAVASQHGGFEVRLEIFNKVQQAHLWVRY